MNISGVKFTEKNQGNKAKVRGGKTLRSDKAKVDVLLLVHCDRQKGF